MNGNIIRAYWGTTLLLRSWFFPEALCAGVMTGLQPQPTPLLTPEGMTQ
jgi:hypothetical protein